MDTINLDQDISACKTFMTCKRHGAASSDCYEVANVYAPTGKLCGTITMQRLQILQHAFDESQKQQLDAHAAFHNLSFAQAVACLLSRYEGKQSTDNNKVRLSQHYTIPDEYMRVMCHGLGAATELFASPLDFNPTHANCFSIFEEDKLLGANHDAFSTKCAAAEMGLSVPSINQLGQTVHGTMRLQGLYPPEGFAKASTAQL